MPDYQKCVIYTIMSGCNLYVGSTCNFTRRKHHHKKNITDPNSVDYYEKPYRTIRENGGEWEMMIFEVYPCNNKTEMRMREHYVRLELEADII